MQAILIVAALSGLGSIIVWARVRIMSGPFVCVIGFNIEQSGTACECDFIYLNSVIKGKGNYLSNNDVGENDR